MVSGPGEPDPRARGGDLRRRSWIRTTTRGRATSGRIGPASWSARRARRSARADCGQAGRRRRRSLSSERRATGSQASPIMAWTTTAITMRIPGTVRTRAGTAHSNPANDIEDASTSSPSPAPGTTNRSTGAAGQGGLGRRDRRSRVERSCHAPGSIWPTPIDGDSDGAVSDGGRVALDAEGPGVGVGVGRAEAIGEADGKRWQRRQRPDGGAARSWAPAAASRSVSVARSGPVSELAPAGVGAGVGTGSASVSVAGLSRSDRRLLCP